MLAAILDFTDVKNVTEGREGEEGTRLGFLLGLESLCTDFFKLQNLDQMGVRGKGTGGRSVGGGVAVLCCVVCSGV